MKKLFLGLILVLFANIAMAQHDNLTVTVDRGHPIDKLTTMMAISTDLHYDISDKWFISNTNSGIYEAKKSYHNEIFSEATIGTHFPDQGLDVGFGTQYYHMPGSNTINDVYFIIRISQTFRL